MLRSSFLAGTRHIAFPRLQQWRLRRCVSAGATFITSRTTSDSWWTRRLPLPIRSRRSEHARQRHELRRGAKSCRARATAAIAMASIAALALYGWDYYLLGAAERPFSPKHELLKPSGAIAIKLGMA